MRPVQRTELLDYQTYAESREQTRPKMLALKEPRRIHVGPVLTYLFENRDTIRYQVQEMMLAERLVKEADIAHELATYNEVLGGEGELGATLLIEIETKEERDEKLRKWLDLPNRLYAKLEDGSKVYATFDSRQVDGGKLSSVHYVKFQVKGRAPVALGCDLPDLKVETPLTQAQRAALSADVSG